jgi:hypothetical protein
MSPHATPRRDGSSLTPTEQERDAKKQQDARDRNREAAKKCREKKKHKEDAIHRQLSRLMQENHELKLQASYMRHQIAQLSQHISMHEHRNHAVVPQGFMNPANYMQPLPGTFYPLVPAHGFAARPQAPWDVPLQSIEQPVDMNELGDQEEVTPPKQEVPAPDSGVKMDFDDESPFY